ncbi:hypothetical protein [Nocardia sp. NPDC052566]|uniref:hypothetical protein n=1 Tax=Nocardia sp. NPDC052566 TaxID=3364330 RepID=UPI0037C96AE7
MVRLADAVVILHEGARRLAVVVESQSDPPRPEKRRAWASYVALAHSEHCCDAVLVVIAPNRSTARSCRQTVRTGHPGFNLNPIVVGPDSTPDPTDPDLASPELTVLAALTGALDMRDPDTQREVLDTIRTIDPDLRSTYTHFIRIATPADALRSLEDLMASTFKDEFIDSFINKGREEGRAIGRAEGRSEGEARFLIHALTKHGLAVSTEVQERITSCTDTEQLAVWFDRALTATSIEEVFND